MENNGFTWGQTLKQDDVNTIRSSGGLVSSEKNFLNRAKEKIPELSDKAWEKFKEIIKEEHLRRTT